jgi:hypothetical protein
MSYLDRFPKSFRVRARTFRAISLFWYIDKVHPDDCKCEGCDLGAKP